MKYPLGLFIKPPALPVDIYLLRYFYTAEFFPKKAVLREYVTEFTFIFLNPIEKNEEKYLGVVKKRTN